MVFFVYLTGNICKEQYETILHGKIRYSSVQVQYGAIQYGTLRCDTIRYRDTVRYNT